MLCELIKHVYIIYIIIWFKYIHDSSNTYICHVYYIQNILPLNSIIYVFVYVYVCICIHTYINENPHLRRYALDLRIMMIEKDIPNNTNKLVKSHAFWFMANI